jgi:hypothetical protein
MKFRSGGAIRNYICTDYFKVGKIPIPPVVHEEPQVPASLLIATEYIWLIWDFAEALSE